MPTKQERRQDQGMMGSEMRPTRTRKAEKGVPSDKRAGTATWHQRACNGSEGKTHTQQKQNQTTRNTTHRETAREEASGEARPPDCTDPGRVLDTWSKSGPKVEKQRATGVGSRLV